MATDYDASRKTEEEQKEESHVARRLTSGEQDKTSGKIDVDETELAASFELHGAALSNATMSNEIVPKQAKVNTEERGIGDKCFSKCTFRGTPLMLITNRIHHKN